MKNVKRKNGVRRTKDIKNIVGDKVIVNRSTGTTGKGSSIAGENRLLNKLSAKGKANLLKIRGYIAEGSKFVSSEEFAGKGLFVEILDVEKRSKGKYGPGFTIKLLDYKSNRERIWNTNSITALRAILRLMEQGVTRMHIFKTGRGTDTRYYAKPAEDTKLQKKKQRKTKR
jgi:hypothetical protein